MAFLSGAGDTATTVLELAGLEGYLGGQQRIAAAWHDVSRAQDAASASAMRLSNQGSILIGGGAAIATSALVIGKSFIKAAGDMQAIRGGFSTMLGSMDAAKSKIGELQKFAAETPFDFKQSAQGAQRLLAMGVSADKLVPTMRSVAQAVAAAGGNTETFLGVLQAIGQIKTKGTLGLEEVQQMSERGIPALQILQKELGLTKDQIANLGNQKIDADKAIGALLAGFDKRFGGALENAAANYNNAESNFSDALDQFKTVSGEALLPMATEALQSLTGLISKATEFTQMHPDVAKYALTFLAIAGAVSVVSGAVLKLRANLLMAAAAQKVLDDYNDGDGGLTIRGGSGGGGRGSRGGGSGALVGGDAAQASDKIKRIHDARIKASRDLSRAARDMDKHAPDSDEGIQARRRYNRANLLRTQLDEREKDVRGKFGETEEGKGVGGGSALGTAKEIAAAIASGEDASDVLKSKLEEIGQTKLDEFIEDPKAALKNWKDQLKNFKGDAIKNFTQIKTFMRGGLSMPSAGTGALGNLGARLGIRAGAINTGTLFGRGGGALTGGGAMMGAALGVGAAVGARDDIKALGASEGAASLYAGILGAVTTGVTAFFPPARLIVGAAELFRLGVDKFYNEPLELAATEGSLGSEGEKKLQDQKGNKRAQADTYFDLAEKARNEGDDTSAMSFMLQANSLNRQAKRDEKDKAMKDAHARAAADQKAAREKDMLENPEKYGGVDPNASPYIRDAQGINPNGAFDSGDGAGDAPPFSMGDRTRRAAGPPTTGSMDFAANYGEGGSNPNDYNARLRQQASVTGGDQGAGYDVTQNRDGSRRIVLEIPRDPDKDLPDRLKAHNRLNTQF